MQELRGTRYTAGSRPEFVEFLTKHLRGMRYRQVERFYKDIGPDLNRAELALLGCNDRYFLLTRLLNRPDAIHPWLFERCREVEAAPDGYLDLWSREHFKSSIITFAGAAQEVFIDPEITIGIFSATQKIAQAFLRQIKEEFQRNESLKDIYRDVLWTHSKDAPVWSISDGIVVRRNGNPKESTIEAWGLLDGMPTGRHFLLRIFDDVLNEKTVTNEEMMRKTIERWELADNLGAGDHRQWGIGTRYHFGDAYGVYLDRKIFIPRIYPATDNGRMDGNPVFWSVKKWEEKKRTQRSTAAAQLLQNPVAGQENSFETTWLRPYVIRPRLLNVYIMGDPSKGKRKTSDRTAIAVVGVDHLGNRYLLDGMRHRMKLSERWEALYRLYRKWKNAEGVLTCNVGWEVYGMQADAEYFQEKMRSKGIEPFAIEDLAWTKEGNQSKKTRVERLEPYFRHGEFFVPAKVYHPDFVDDGSGHASKLTGARNATWKVDEETGRIDYRAITGEMKEERVARAQGEGYRIIEPIRRKDEDGNIYDLTRVFFEEYQYFPFSAKDDLIDAISRIEDMNASAPMVYDTEVITVPHYHD